MQKILGNLLFVVPKNIFSHFVGIFAHFQLPGVLRLWSLRWFAGRYSINMAEAEKELAEYNSIGDLFIRRLKPGLRPIDQEASIVHPSDSKLTQCHPVLGDELIQAKGKSYSLESFLGSAELAEKVKGGLTCTYYLCPTDYHRVHSPVSGKVLKVTHIPGRLWPVNDWSVKRIDQLFAINERLVVEMETETGNGKGVAVVVMVGATNVGKMELSFDSHWRTNLHEKRKRSEKEYDPGVFLEKGQEFGFFRMGSTVISFYDRQMVGEKLSDLQKIELGAEVKVGAPLA